MPATHGGTRSTAHRPRRPSAPGRTPRRPGSRPASTAPRRPEPSELERALSAAQEVPEPEPKTFAELGLPAALVSMLGRSGVTTPFAIQARTMSDALAGRDILGRAQTGSGKTLAFGLPVLARLAASGTGPAHRTPGAPRALVLVPTRELANQVAAVLGPLGHAVGLSVTTVYGGMPIGKQITQIRRGVDVVVATPGRLIDLLERGACGLDRIEITVLDEADYLADLGFLPAVTRLLDATPAGGQRLLFSATLDRGIDRLVRDYLHDPAIHAVASASAPVENADHRVFVLPAVDKVTIATEIAVRPGRTLFFVRTKHGADRLARQLTKSGVDASAIHGNLNQNQRQRVLDGFTAGHPRVLIATDVAARGLDIDDVDLVVHFDPPNDHKDYLHRSGRTARAGASGTVLALVEPGQVREVARLHAGAKVTPTTHTVLPGHAAVRQIAASGVPVPPKPPEVPVVAGARSRPAGGSGGEWSGRRTRRPSERSGQGGPTGQAGRPGHPGRTGRSGRPAATT